jgi:hypothetical protein
VAPASAVTLTANPGVFNFSYTIGVTPQPAPQTLNVGVASGAAAQFTASASTSAGGNWLSVSAASGTTPAQLTVTANPSGVAPGSYSGTIQLTAANANPVDIPVWLTVKPKPSNLVVSALNFAFVNGSMPNMVYVLAADQSAVHVTATVTSISGGNWLSVNPASFTTPTLVNLVPDPSGKAPGNYSAVVHLTPDGGGVPLDLNCTLIVMPQNSPNGGSATVTVQDPASGQQFAMRPGSMNPGSMNPGAPPRRAR